MMKLPFVGISPADRNTGPSGERTAACQTAVGGNRRDIMTNTTGQNGAPASIDPATTLGSATLGVADAERSLRFYRDLLGFEVIRHDAGRIELGAGGVTLLVLEPRAGLRPRPQSTTGLYHVAILLPSRLDLA